MIAPTLFEIIVDVADFLRLLIDFASLSGRLGRLSDISGLFFELVNTLGIK